MSAKPRILLSAFGLHMGGGLVLLRALVGALGDNLKWAALDARAQEDPALADHLAKASWIPRNFVSRAFGLIRLARLARPGDTLLCLNSLPPLIKPRCRVVNYVHALYLVNMHRDSHYDLKTRLRIVIERCWFSLGARHCDEFWVQTPSMADALQRLHPGCTVRIAPFVDDALALAVSAHRTARARATPSDADYVFYYPAEAVGHKNHVNLLKAWSLLHARGHLPKLVLTLTPDEVNQVGAVAALSIGQMPTIRNLGRISRQEALRQMAQSSALIFPSLAETLGLPMLEATAQGIPIIASERDFVRDVCEPVLTFDPRSPQSIANAVQRFMGVAPQWPPLLNARQFVDQLCPVE